MANKELVAAADRALLAELGYKQEFRREFKPLEVRSLHRITLHKRALNCYRTIKVFGIAFSIIGLLPSIA